MLSAAMHHGWRVKTPPARPQVVVPAGRKASPRTGRGHVLLVLRYADQRAANTFESAQRALCIEAGLDVEPQVQIGDIGQCDVGDRSRRIAIEGDSFRYHSSPSAYERDVHRYTAVGRMGWLVLRFTLDAVFERPGIRADSACSGANPSSPRSDEVTLRKRLRATGWACQDDVGPRIWYQ